MEGTQLGCDYNHFSILNSQLLQNRENLRRRIRIINSYIKNNKGTYFDDIIINKLIEYRKITCEIKKNNIIIDKIMQKYLANKFYYDQFDYNNPEY